MSNIRQIHRIAAPWIFILLVVTLGTGILYRIGRAWFGFSRETGNQILSIHAGDWLGENISPYYVLLVGGSLLALIITGAILTIKSRSQAKARKMHRWLGIILMLPLLISAVTGIAFKLGEEWFHMPEDSLKFLMMLHEGDWLGKQGKPFYVLFVGLGLLALGIYGLQLTTWMLRRKAGRG